MDAQQRASWRQRLEATYGSWLCPICKTAYAAQAQFAQMVGVADLVRHSGCGHVIMWRAGGADWLEPYLAEVRQAALPYSPAQLDPMPRQQPQTPRQP